MAIVHVLCYVCPAKRCLFLQTDFYAMFNWAVSCCIVGVVGNYLLGWRGTTWSTTGLFDDRRFHAYCGTQRSIHRSVLIRGLCLDKLENEVGGMADSIVMGASATFLVGRSGAITTIDSSRRSTAVDVFLLIIFMLIVIVCVLPLDQWE